MTNYGYFPKHRRYGIVIKFAEDRYSWCENNLAQRKYLAGSSYCDKALEFYVWKNNKTYKTFEDFKTYLLNEHDEKPKSKRTVQSPIDENSKLYFTCKCIMCEISGYPYEAPKSHKALAEECKKYLLDVLNSQTKNRNIYDLIFACSNLSFNGYHLAWNKDAWIKSSLIVYNYFKAKTLIQIVYDYNKIFNEQIVFNYNELLDFFFKSLFEGTEINYSHPPGVKSSFSYIPTIKFEEKLVRFKELYE